jgi:hypothetical protein
VIAGILQCDGCLGTDARVSTAIPARIDVGREVEPRCLEDLLRERVARRNTHSSEERPRDRAEIPRIQTPARLRDGFSEQLLEIWQRILPAVVDVAVSIQRQRGETHRRDAANEIANRELRCWELPLTVSAAHSSGTPPQRPRMQVAGLDGVVRRHETHGSVRWEVDDRELKHHRVLGKPALHRGHEILVGLP